MSVGIQSWWRITPNPDGTAYVQARRPRSCWAVGELAPTLAPAARSRSWPLATLPAHLPCHPRAGVLLAVDAADVEGRAVRAVGCRWGGTPPASSPQPCPPRTSSLPAAPHDICSLRPVWRGSSPSARPSCPPSRPAGSLAPTLCVVPVCMPCHAMCLFTFEIAAAASCCTQPPAPRPLRPTPASLLPPSLPRSRRPRPMTTPSGCLSRLAPPTATAFGLR